MNRDQKAAVVDEVATQIQEADAVFAIDYRGLSVTQAVELRSRLGEADAAFRVVKNRLTSRAADKAGVESLKELLEGPTAFAFVRGDAALAAKAIATFRREHQLLSFKGGVLDGETLSVDQLEAISRLPARDVLQGQFVGVLASPVTGLVRGLGALIQGLALQLGQLQEQGLVGGEAPAEAESAAAEEADAGGGEQMTDGGDAGTDAEGGVAGAEAAAPGDPVAEAEEAEPQAATAEEGADGADDAGEEAAAPGDPVAEAEQAETSGDDGGEAAAEASDEQTAASDEAEPKEE